MLKGNFAATCRGSSENQNNLTGQAWVSGVCAEGNGGGGRTNLPVLPPEVFSDGRVTVALFFSACMEKYGFI